MKYGGKAGSEHLQFDENISGEVSEVWMKTVIAPVFKGKGSKFDRKN